MVEMTTSEWQHPLTYNHPLLWEEMLSSYLTHCLHALTLNTIRNTPTFMPMQCKCGTNEGKSTQPFLQTIGLSHSQVVKMQCQLWHCMTSWKRFTFPLLKTTSFNWHTLPLHSLKFFTWPNRTGTPDFCAQHNEDEARQDCEPMQSHNPRVGGPYMWHTWNSTKRQIVH